MKRVSWKYLAGFIDGEGCIDVQITKHSDPKYQKRLYVRPRLRVAMADNAAFLLKDWQANFGGHLTYRKSKSKQWQSATSWECAGYKQSCPVLRNVVNHLILKREQARFCLWLESNIKGQFVSTEVVDTVRNELKLMKRDPHRLSERAQQSVLSALGCDSRAA